ncbi:helix-turn-helix domain-containing protein [Intestinimonas massiliensis (ex Afouda et al. 2020)]|uniref:helix-turn-helix domain-containing protein n=1 Tax=Intestinimonas massiliensis (ex Afouda et al. 2020) TaxID=1673721 RepID=UPI001F5FB92A|nr:AraC family transcriptional regulator [Intestinimonas massiliensis (ex Afouda et al. 2020)]
MASSVCCSSLTVGDVGYLVGFCEQSYFVKVFRKYTGITPRQYRQQALSSWPP